MAVLEVTDPLGEGYDAVQSTNESPTDFANTIPLWVDTAGNLQVLLMWDPSTANPNGPTDTVEVVLHRPSTSTTRYQVETSWDQLEKDFKEFNTTGNPDLNRDEINNTESNGTPDIDTITCTSVNNKWAIPINNFWGTSGGESPIVTVTKNSAPVPFQIVNNAIVIDYSAWLEGDVGINLSNHADGAVIFSKDTIVDLQVINEMAIFNAQTYTDIPQQPDSTKHTIVLNNTTGYPMNYIVTCVQPEVGTPMSVTVPNGWMQYGIVKWNEENTYIFETRDLLGNCTNDSHDSLTVAAADTTVTVDSDDINTNSTSPLSIRFVDDKIQLKNLPKRTHVMDVFNMMGEKLIHGEPWDIQWNEGEINGDYLEDWLHIIRWFDIHGNLIFARKFMVMDE